MSSISLRHPLRTRAAAHDSDSVIVELGPASVLDRLRELAALPIVKEEREAGEIVLRFYVPGATRKNSQVVWVPDEQRLVIGVWAGAVPRERRPFFPSLLWSRSTRLPDADGSRATAWVRRGVLEVHVPRV